MRWLLDQGLPRSAAGILHDSKEDAIHVGDIGMSEAHDREVIRHALSEDRIICYSGLRFPRAACCRGRFQKIRHPDSGRRPQGPANRPIDFAYQSAVQGRA